MTTVKADTTAKQTKLAVEGVTLMQQSTGLLAYQDSY